MALEYGLASPLFAMSLCFSLIVMYDATGVRRHAGLARTPLEPLLSPAAFLTLCAPAGKQAEVLNIVLTEVLEGHPVRDVKLKEMLGHTPLQVSQAAQSRPSSQRCQQLSLPEHLECVCRCLREHCWAVWLALCTRIQPLLL